MSKMIQYSRVNLKYPDKSGISKRIVEKKKSIDLINATLFFLLASVLLFYLIKTIKGG